MAKSIFKEIVIGLLLSLAIIIVLGVLLYDYVPSAKALPNPVSYSTPTEVKEELEKSQEIDESKIMMTYEIDSADLNNYTRTRDYKPGKANPFSTYEQATTNGNTTDVTSNTGTINNNTSSATSGNANSQNTQTNSQSESSSGGQFFQDKGTK